MSAFGAVLYIGKNVSEAKIQKTESLVRTMLDDAQRKAEALKKEMVLEAKEDILRQRNEFEKKRVIGVMKRSVLKEDYNNVRKI